MACMSSCSSGKATGANIWQQKENALKANFSKVNHGQKFIKFMSLTLMNFPQVLFPATTTELVPTLLRVAEGYCSHHQRAAILWTQASYQCQ
jgi:hypothetical protein